MIANPLLRFTKESVESLTVSRYLSPKKKPPIFTVNSWFVTSNNSGERLLVSLLVVAEGNGGVTETIFSGSLLLLIAFLSLCDFGSGGGIDFVAGFVGNDFIVASVLVFALALSLVVVAFLSGGASGISILRFSDILGRYRDSAEFCMKTRPSCSLHNMREPAAALPAKINSARGFDIKFSTVRSR